MKRAQFLQAFWLLPPLAFWGCKKETLPTTPTIITGKLVFEDGTPVEGYQFQFLGRNQTGFLKATSLFNLKDKTDKDGKYKFSIVIPDATDIVSFTPIGVLLQNGVADKRYVIYSLINGKLESPKYLPINYGITNEFNYTVKILTQTP